MAATLRVHGGVTIPRRAIDRELARGLKDVANGRVHGPFATAEEFSASMESEIKKIRTARKSQRRR